MTKSAGIFVKINYKMDMESRNRIREKKMNYKSNNSSKYLLCGGTYNKNGGTFIFQADSLEEAQLIVSDNPFVDTSSYSFEILSKNNIRLCC